MDKKEARKKLSEIEPHKFNPKTSLKGVEYNGILFCSVDCFLEEYNDVKEEKLDRVIVSSSMTKGQGNIGSCVVCSKNIET